MLVLDLYSIASDQIPLTIELESVLGEKKWIGALLI